MISRTTLEKNERGMILNMERIVFEFFSMTGNYEERKVARYTKDGVDISTAAVNDSSKPFETAIGHAQYNDGKWIIVELYDTKEEARKGHDKWIEIMTAKKLPAIIKDVGDCEIALFDE